MGSTDRPRPGWLGLAFACTIAALATQATAGERSTYASDLAAFFAEVDRSYPFFELKGVREDWGTTKRDARGSPASA